MNEYREAKCIELHDANIALVTDNQSYENVGLIGRTTSPDKPAYRIQLGDLAMIAEMFGVVPPEDLTPPKSSDQTTATPGKPNSVNLLEFPIYRAHFDQTGGTTQQPRISKISCLVQSEKLVHITVATEYTDPPGFDEESITYSGSFTIWWQD